MSTTFLATAPDGSVLTRTSKNRTYTHAIIGRWSFDYAIKAAEKICDMDKINFDYHVAMANGSHRHAASESEEHMLRHRTIANGFKDRDAYAAQMSVDRCNRIHAQKAEGRFSTFGALTWCGRPDLAQKEFLRCSAAEYHTDVTCVAVTIKPKKS